MPCNKDSNLTIQKKKKIRSFKGSVCYLNEKKISLPSLERAGAGAGEWEATTAGEIMANTRAIIITAPITPLDDAIFSL